MKTNQELKHELWEKLSKSYSHLSNYFTLELNGIDDDSIYFHPKFIIDTETYISSQVDIGTNNIYAFSITINKAERISIPSELVENIIIGLYTNTEVVGLALDCMVKINQHIEQMRQYSSEYITNVLIGSSIDSVTDCFINELSANKKIISFIQNKITSKTK